MFIAVVGTRHAGKTTLQQYLVDQLGFTQVRLTGESREPEAILSPSVQKDASGRPQRPGVRPNNDLSFLSMSSQGTASGTIGIEGPAEQISEATTPRTKNALFFVSWKAMLDHVTRNWREQFVTEDLDSKDLVEIFVKRPSFFLVSVDAPLLVRFQRSKSKNLESFIEQHDREYFGHGQDTNERKCLQSLADMANVKIVNASESIEEFHKHLKSVNLTDTDRLRPQWDTYFMTLASLASRRSNCMKRRVGAILVRNNRIVATGYNGTPRGLPNCNEGGCAACNRTNPANAAPHECVCLHAEENALLEAGRERVGNGAVLYCNTCPCLKCTVKIIQNGVTDVVYNLSYKVDDASAELFRQAGVGLRRHALPS